MKSIVLAMVLFFAFLLVRRTFTMEAKGTAPVAAEPRSINPDTRARRLAALEAQDQALTLQQQALEAELERSGESSARVRDRQERVATVAADEDAPSDTPRDLDAEQQQLQRRRRETRSDLEKVVAERHRIQEEWSQLTGLHTAR